MLKKENEILKKNEENYKKNISDLTADLQKAENRITQ